MGLACEGTRASAGALPAPLRYSFQMGRGLSLGLRSAGCAEKPRTAGAAHADVVTARYSIVDAEAGRIESIRRAVLATLPRTAGNNTSNTSNSNTSTFDPRDPASMTEARWRALSPEAQRAWIEANVRDEARRAQMITDIANGVFGSINTFINAERDRRRTEVTEAAQTERNRTNQQEDTRRALAREETERLRIQAQEARDRAAAAEREATEAQNETTRLRAQAEADAARERQARTEADLAAARARESEATASAERERLATIQANASFFGTTGGKVVAGVAGVAVVGVLAAIAIKLASSPPPPPPPPALPTQAQR